LQTDGLHRYCFIEKHQSHFSQLLKLRDRFPTKSIELLQGDANAILPLLLAELDARHWRGVLFLDPYGMGFAWETLKAIAATGLLDVWYLFPLSGVFRQASRSLDAVDQHKAAALDCCLGTPAWRDAIYREERQLDLFGNAPGMERFADVDAIEHFVSNRLQEVFPAVAKPLHLPHANGSAVLFVVFRGFQSVTKSPGTRAEVCQGHPGEGSVMVPAAAPVPWSCDDRDGGGSRIEPVDALNSPSVHGHRRSQHR
jgi:three-Cys-motif partner protein